MTQYLKVWLNLRLLVEFMLDQNKWLKSRTLFFLLIKQNKNLSPILPIDAHTWRLKMCVSLESKFQPYSYYVAVSHLISDRHLIPALRFQSLFNFGKMDMFIKMFLRLCQIIRMIKLARPQTTSKFSRLNSEVSERQGWKYNLGF